ncbi:MAG: hypothetical protein FWD57_13345 [Polyangiaceae bacterium]|nr:hypothetical protein [Polyangiaceae bacterium]
MRLESTALPRVLRAVLVSALFFVTQAIVDGRRHCAMLQVIRASKRDR